MNTHVNFESAKLLKEKGFDLPTLYYYDSFGDMGSAGDDTINWNQSEEFLQSAPTIAETVMWLYEKHGVWINSDFSEVDESFTYKIHLINSDKLPRIFTDCGYNSPTEAYQEAIIYSLKNLI